MLTLYAAHVRYTCDARAYLPFRSVLDVKPDSPRFFVYRADSSLQSDSRHIHTIDLEAVKQIVSQYHPLFPVYISYFNQFKLRFSSL